MIRRFRSRAVLALVACTIAATARADVLVVTNTNDADNGSLRAAIGAAVAGDSIVFAIEAVGVQTISPVTALPAIAAGISIDGTTQPGASCNAWPPTLRIEVDGSATPDGTHGLTIGGDGVMLRGLVVNRFPGDGIHVQNAGNAAIQCNFIGTDPGGTLDFGNGGAGVGLASAQAVVGGNVSQRNLIAGNAIAGVRIDANSSNTTVVGNYIGTDVSGAARLDNFNGVVVRGASNTIATDNLISGNTEHGVMLDAATAIGNQIHANQVGPNAADSASLPNGGAGVYLVNGASENAIGMPGLGNRFRDNGANGVWVEGDTTLRNSIRANSMSGNGGIGIELGAAFFENPNDPGDPDSGPNRLQNTPELVHVAYAAGLDQITAVFSVSTAPVNATYPLLVDFYHADFDDEEGEVYLGTLGYDTDDFAIGVVTKSFTPLGEVAVGDEVVATATDADGNTSEFTATSLTVVAPEPATWIASAVALGALATLGARHRAQA